MGHSLSKSLVVPDFSLLATSGLESTLKAYRGKKVVLYFYPKDNTPGCSCEIQEFRDLYPEFQQWNTLIFGISRDSLSSHEKFKEKYQAPFELISDTKEELCQWFGVVKSKGFFGKIILGLERCTFLLDEKGRVVKEWRKVSAKGHAKAVLEAVKV